MSKIIIIILRRTRETADIIAKVCGDWITDR